MGRLTAPFIQTFSEIVTNSTLSAKEIAEQQLEMAIQLWHAKQYVSAITLAGAAEEILGKCLRRSGMEPSFDNIKASIIKISRLLVGNEDPESEKIVAELFNQTKNELKHYAGDDSLSFNLIEDSVDLLERAITNYQMLTGTVTDSMISFWKEIDRN